MKGWDGGAWLEGVEEGGGKGRRDSDSGVRRGRGRRGGRKERLLMGFEGVEEGGEMEGRRD